MISDKFIATKPVCHHDVMDLWTLCDLCTPWCVHVVATLRIADHIEAGNTDIDRLAAASGADRDSLYRVLRHLVSKGLFQETARGRFALNEPARALLEYPVRLGLDLDGIGGRMAYAWGTLLSAVRSGRPAYHEAFGRGFWEDLDAHPDVAFQGRRLIGCRLDLDLAFVRKQSSSPRTCSGDM